MSATFETLRREVIRQDNVYGPFTADVSSTRLAIACLEDEVAECLDAWNRTKRLDDIEPLRDEAFQVAAVALRLAKALSDETTRRFSREVLDMSTTPGTEASDGW